MAVNLVTSPEIEARLGRPLSADELARVEALLADASAAVRSYTGQTLTRATSTATLPVVGGRVSLPQRPVIAVASAQSETGWLLDEPNVFGSVVYDVPGCRAVVTYEHGYDEVPDDLVAVVCSMVLRSLGSSPTGVGKSSESIGDYSYRLAASTLARRPVVDSMDRAVLDRYRLPAIGAIGLANP